DGAAAIAAATGQRVLDVGSSPPTMRLLSLPPALLPDEAVKDQVQATLAADTGVEVSLPWWNGAGYLRISAHLYNKPEDYTIAAERYATAFASTEALAAR
ncbi:MAG: hypothetical protein ACRDQA_01215, partial [Nocardioidaceae bacterium]